MAIVEGKVVEEIVIDKPILTTKDRGVAKSKVDKNGKSAKTTVYPLLVEGNKSKIKLVIESGRTHQIRVHFSYLKWPLVGDLIYGGKELFGLKRPFLQAAELQFEHPANGQQMSYKVELAKDLREVIEKL